MELLDEELTPDEREKFQTARALLEHGSARLNLDFEGARAALSGTEFNTGKRLHWRHSAAQSSISLQRLYEITWTARILLARRDYGNFVVRTATLVETCRRQLVRFLLGFDPGRSLGLAGLSSSLSSLERSLRAKYHRGKLYAWDSEGNQLKVNTPLREAVIEWGSISSGNDTATSQIADAYERISTLASLGDLRNEIVHDACGPSRQKINTIFPECRQRFPRFVKELLASMKHVHRAHGRPTQVTDRIYKDLNDDILAELRAR